MSNRRPVLVAAGVAIAVALVGGAMTETGPWYRGLEKSAATPPDWAFGPAWTLIYALAVLSAVSGWRATRSRADQAWLLTEAASVRLALIVFLWPLSRRASMLLVPYLCWVAFAAYLNVRIVALNGPFR